MTDRTPLLAPPAPTPLHRGGTGSTLVLLHGITAHWPIWSPLLTALEREHDVFAPTLPGHWGGPPLAGEVTLATLADATERILDEHAIERAHLVGNSLGGWLAIELGRRGRALSVTGLSPAGGWTHAKDVRRVVQMLSSAQRLLSYRQRLRLQSLVRRPRVRRLAFAGAMEHGERLTPAEAWVMIEAAANCEIFAGFMDWVRSTEPLARAVSEQDYPITIAWGERDRTLPLTRYGGPVYAVIPAAEQVTLKGVGHVPMYDDPALVVHTILETTRRAQTTHQEQEQPRAERS
jgi:pimeloyl-ACP methyl ester carboxylesterase